jgi:hypothetical protein
MASKSYSEFMEILIAINNERLASLPDDRSTLSSKERMEVFNEVAIENSNEEEMKLLIEKLKEIKPEEIKND